MKKLLMRKDMFWKLIGEVKERFKAESGDASGDWLINQLLGISIDELISFGIYLETYLEMGKSKYGLWSAVAAVMGGCSDDHYEYFLGWLIMQGENAYMSVLKNPDALADVIESGQPYLSPQNYENEWLINAPVAAFHKATGKEYKAYFLRVEPELTKYKDTILEGCECHPLLGYPLTHVDVLLAFPNLARKFDISKSPDFFSNSWNLEINEIKDNYEKGRDKLIDFLETRWRKKTSYPKDRMTFERLLVSGSMCRAYVKALGGTSSQEFILINSPKNLADFICAKGAEGDITVTDIYDQFILNTMMIYLDRCADPDYCEEIRKEIVPIQTGEREPGEYVALERDKADCFFKELFSGDYLRQIE